MITTVLPKRKLPPTNGGSSSLLRSASFYIYPADVAIASSTAHHTIRSSFLPLSNETNFSEVPHPLKSIITSNLSLTPSLFFFPFYIIARLRAIRQFLSIPSSRCKSSPTRKWNYKCYMKRKCNVAEEEDEPSHLLSRIYSYGI